jgi:uncharacterized membrane protein YhhN
VPSSVVWFVVLVGAGHLAAYYGGSRALAGTLKSLPILALAAVVVASRSSVDARYATWLTAGLLASAVGDVCLVWPERFTWGLGSFLVAHCLYVAAFAAGAAAGGIAWPWLAGILGTAAILLARLWPHLGQVRGAVLLYVAVIALMAWTAARRAGAPGTPVPSGVLALVGSLLFMTSDAILALDRFAHRIPAAHAVVMVTYYAAQTLIASSAVTGSA